MTETDRILAMWRRGYDTYEIATRISELTKREVKEFQVHKIITAERNERKARLGFTTIEGGRNAANAK